MTAPIGTPENFYSLLRTDPDAALRDVTARRELHRATVHKTTNPEDWFDCSSCGVLDRQLLRAEEANGKKA